MTNPTIPALDDWRALAEEVADDVVAWRRHLHRHPELSFHEHATADFVAEQLASIGGFTITRPTATSVVGVLRGGQPGPVLAVRADMDALPIDEESGVPFASENPGVMHACGHDGHTAVLLGVAHILGARRELVHGELRFLFQHAEELFPGGAQQLVDVGVLDGVETVLGLHLMADGPSGALMLRAGPAMAAPDTFSITVRGKGGHGAMPQTAVDPVAIGAQIVGNLHQLVSRAIDPVEPVVVSVTRFHAGSADNVIPDSAELGGTVRTFDADLRDSMPALMERVVKGLTEAHGAGYEFAYERGYRALVNDDSVTERLRGAFETSFGPERVATPPRIMGGEDFSAYLAVRPGTFFFVGARPPEPAVAYPHHHPRFAIDEAALPVAVEAFLTAIAAMTES